MKLSFKGKHIVLTRSVSVGDDWQKHLRLRGAIVYRFPTIETLPVPLTNKLRHALMHLNDFGWIIFTSAAGPFYTKEILKRLHIGPSAKQTLPIAAIGPKTAEAVRKIGYRVRFMPSRPDSATLARELKPLRSPILLLRADIASSELPRALKAHRMRVVDIPVYKTKILRDQDPRFSKLLKDGTIDYLTFASLSAVTGFVARLKGDAAAIKTARTIPAIVLSPRIKKALLRVGFRDVICLGKKSL